jgi:hypothetical protein
VIPVIFMVSIALVWCPDIENSGGSLSNDTTRRSDAARSEGGTRRSNAPDRRGSG